MSRGLYAVDLTEGVVTAMVSHDSKINWLEVRMADPLWDREQSLQQRGVLISREEKYTTVSILLISMSSFRVLIKRGTSEAWIVCEPLCGDLSL